MPKGTPQIRTITDLGKDTSLEKCHCGEIFVKYKDIELCSNCEISIRILKRKDKEENDKMQKL